jgi:hypothetical protein
VNESIEALEAFDTRLCNRMAHRLCLVCAALHYTALHCSTPHYNTVHCTALHCITLHYATIN